MFPNPECATKRKKDLFISSVFISDISACSAALFTKYAALLHHSTAVAAGDCGPVHMALSWLTRSRIDLEQKHVNIHFLQNVGTERTEHQILNLTWSLSNLPKVGQFLQKLSAKTVHQTKRHVQFWRQMTHAGWKSHLAQRLWYLLLWYILLELLSQTPNCYRWTNRITPRQGKKIGVR